MKTTRPAKAVKCLECGNKRLHPSKGEALVIASRASAGRPLRAYACPHNPGWWHLTSQVARR